jgi:hypothetical protein
MKRVILLGSALAIAALALSIHLLTAGGTTARSGRVTVLHTRAALAGPVVRARRLHALARSTVLAAPASAPLVGNLGAVAVPSRRGTEIAYNTWRWARQIDWQQTLSSQGIQTGDVLGTPTLHLLDERTGLDTALEPGTFSAAWRADGALAYVRATSSDYRANTPYLRDVVVRASTRGKPEVWSTSPDRYVVIGWAKRSLIVADQIPGGGVEVIAFSGAGSAHPLATNAEPLAISPDGSTVLTAESQADTSTPALRLVAVSDAHEVARIPLAKIVDPVTDSPITWVTGPAHWLGDRIVASASSGLVVIHATPSSASVEQVLHVDSATRPNGMLYEPRFGGDDTRTIVAWSDVAFGSLTAQLVCDRFALTCREGTRMPSTDAPRPVYDQSGGDQ